MSTRVARHRAGCVVVIAALLGAGSCAETAEWRPARAPVAVLNLQPTTAGLEARFVALKAATSDPARQAQARCLVAECGMVQDRETGRRVRQEFVDWLLARGGVNEAWSADAVVGLCAVVTDGRDCLPAGFDASVGQLRRIRAVTNAPEVARAAATALLACHVWRDVACGPLVDGGRAEALALLAADRRQSTREDDASRERSVASDRRMRTQLTEVRPGRPAPPADLARWILREGAAASDRLTLICFAAMNGCGTPYLPVARAFCERAGGRVDLVLVQNCVPRCWDIAEVVVDMQMPGWTQTWVPAPADAAEGDAILDRWGVCGWSRSYLVDSHGMIVGWGPQAPVMTEAVRIALGIAP